MSEAIRIRGLHQAFGENVILDQLDLDVAPGEFVALLGRSGSGKTTLLRILAGLDVPAGGAVETPQPRSVVFQEARLLPWKRTWENVVLGLTAPDARALATRALAEVGLEHRAAAWPLTLSGGEAQRAALARALVREPKLLLLDEPFASVDALTRIRMHALVVDLWRRHRPAVLLVTHDVDWCWPTAGSRATSRSTSRGRVSRRMPPFTICASSCSPRWASSCKRRRPRTTTHSWGVFEMIRRGRFLATTGAAAAMAVAGPVRAQDAKQLRIGYQKNGLLLIAKQQGALAKRLEPLGINVSWVEFQSGPPLLESLNAGALDIGETGDTPPIFAQAAGAKLVYVAAAPDAGRRSGILVHADGGIDKLADLKGKRIAFTKGSSAHNVVVHALAAGGLTYGDIQPIYLQPADAAAAFRNGSVDAWSVWDPFFALGQRYPNTRTLVTAEKISPSNRFYLGGTDYVARNPEIVATFVEELGRGGRWATTHPVELAAVVVQTTGVEPDIAKIVASRDIYDVTYITDPILKQQQEIADAFAQLGLIPQRVDVKAIAYAPSAKARAALAQIEGAKS